MPRNLEATTPFPKVREEHMEHFCNCWLNWTRYSKYVPTTHLCQNNKCCNTFYFMVFFLLYERDHTRMFIATIVDYDCTTSPVNKSYDCQTRESLQDGSRYPMKKFFLPKVSKPDIFTSFKACVSFFQYFVIELCSQDGT